MEFKCGIFDMDGTLIDSMPMWRQLGLNLLLSRGIQPRADFADAMKALTTREGCAYCKEQYGLTESVQELIDECWGRVSDFYIHEARPMPGVIDFLQRMKQRGVRLFLATATERAYANLALEATGLAPYFEGMLTCPEVGVGKRFPDIYEQALAQMGCAKEDAIVFEDALYAIRTAKQAGFRVAAIHDPALIHDHPEILALADYYVETYEAL